MTEIDQLYAALAGDLSPDWITGKTHGRRSLTIRNRGVSAKIQSATGTDIAVQFWKHCDSNFNLEFIGDETHRILRNRLATSLRQFILRQPRPSWVEFSGGSTVIHLEKRKFAADKNDAAVDFFRYAVASLATWAEGFLPAVLAGDTPEADWWQTALRMARTSADTAAYANGQEVSRRIKNKDWIFGSEVDGARYLMGLLTEQGNRCALTGIPIEPDRLTRDPELAPSLDRIDSNGQYEPGNLQVVCWFANRWKSDRPDSEFRRLLDLVREKGHSKTE